MIYHKQSYKNIFFLLSWILLVIHITCPPPLFASSDDERRRDSFSDRRTPDDNEQIDKENASSSTVVIKPIREEESYDRQQQEPTEKDRSGRQEEKEHSDPKKEAADKNHSEKVIKGQPQTQERVEKQQQLQFKQDLAVTDMEVILPAVHQGDTVLLIATIINKGESKIADVDVNFYLENSLISEESTTLGSGEKKEIQITTKMTEIGNHKVSVRVDPQNRINEKDEHNNKQVQMVEVVPQPEEGSIRFGAPSEPMKDVKETDTPPEVDESSQLLANSIDLRVQVPTTNGFAVGEGKSITVQVFNQGILPATKPFRVGICKAKDVHLPDTSKYLATVVIQPGPKGFSSNKEQIVTLPWNPEPDPKINYVAIVDTDNSVDEEKEKGEKNNISNTFQYKLTPVSINSLEADPQWMVNKEWFYLTADVIGENYWVIYLDYLGLSGKVLKSIPSSWKVGQYPQSGIKLPPPFPNPQNSEQIRVRLKAENSFTNTKAEKFILVKKGYPLDGKLSIINSSYTYDPVLKKITNIILTLKAQSTTNTFFRIDGYGNSGFGSVYLAAVIYNKGWGYFSSDYSGLEREVTTPVSSDLYSIMKTPGTKALKQVKPVGSIFLNNQEAQFSISFKPECLNKVSGYKYVVDDGSKPLQTGKAHMKNVYPYISITLFYHTKSGKQKLEYTIPIKDADLHFTYGVKKKDSFHPK